MSTTCIETALFKALSRRSVTTEFMPFLHYYRVSAAVAAAADVASTRIFWDPTAPHSAGQLPEQQLIKACTRSQSNWFINLLDHLLQATAGVIATGEPSLESLSGWPGAQVLLWHITCDRSDLRAMLYCRIHCC